MRRYLVAGMLAAALPARAAHGSFHIVQIEQVIGGVNGDVTRQAIQLRMRQPNQNLLQVTRIRAWDAAGANPVLVMNMTSNVANGAAGARALIATPNFLPGLVPDYVMTTPIPAEYLAAGKLTFETDGGFVYWSLAWGGAAYTGTNLGGDITNDFDGDFSPPFAGPLPSTGTQAVLFTGPAAAASTNNAADYVLTGGAAVFTNNGGGNGTVPVELIAFEVN